MSRYGNVKAGAYNKLNVDSESSDTSEKLNDVERVLNKMGISIRKTNLEFKDFDDVLDEIADRWGTLDNVTKRAMANAFAGVRQNEAFLVLMENYDKYKDLLEVSETSKGTAERKYQSYRESYAFARNELTAALEELANSSEVSKLLTDIVKVETNLLKVLQRIYPYLPAIANIFFTMMGVQGKGLLSSGAKFMTNMRANGLGGAIGAIGKKQGGDAGTTNGATNIPFFATASKVGKLNAGLAVADIALTTLMTSVSQFVTAATTHKNAEGKTVESSKEAQKQGAAVSAAISLIPVIGGIVGPMRGEAIATEIDKARDNANLTTERANERLNKLKSVQSSLDNIQKTELSSAERHKLVQSFKQEIFDSENEALRNQLRKQLGAQGKSLSDLLSGIEDDTSALKTVQAAQYELQKQEIANKYASTQFQDSEDLSKLYSKIDDYDGSNSGIGWGAVGITSAGTAGGALTGMLAGALFGPIGIAVGGLIGAISGAIAGGTYGANWAEDAKSSNRKKHNLGSVGSWGSQNALERKATAEEKIAELETSVDAIDEYFATHEREAYLYQTALRLKDVGMFTARDEYGNSKDYYTNDILKPYENYTKNKKLLEYYEQLLDALDRQIAMQSQIRDEINEVTLQQALTLAELKNSDGEGTGRYLDQMSISELKALGIDEILKTYGHAVDASGGLSGLNVFDKDGNLTDVGYDYLYEQLRKQGDDEINAVLTGGSYSLQEALNLRARYKDSKTVRRILENFSSALGVTVDELENVTDQFGMLTVSDLLGSTTDIHTKISGFADLMSSITNGAGDISTWMETIISQYPSLIQYMGNTSELFTQAISNMKQLSNAALNAQGDEVLGSTDFFNKYLTLDENGVDRFYDSLSEKAAAQLREASPSSFAGVLDWVVSQYHYNKEKSEWELTEEASEVANLMSDIFVKSGIQLMDSSMKSYYEMLISYQTTTLDKEIKNLNEQKAALKEINSQREYENKLVEARLKLEDAAKQKKRVYRAGVGWVYEADQSAIESAQKELDAVDREKQIAVLDDQIALKEKQKEELSSIFEKENYEMLEKLYGAAQKEGDVTKDINSNISMISGAIDGIKQSLDAYLDKEKASKETEKANKLKVADQAWQKVLSANPGTGEYNTALKAYHSAFNDAIAAGATEEDFASFKTYGKSNARGILQGRGAYSVGKGSYSNQEMYYNQHFAIANHEGEGYFKGYTNGDLAEGTIKDSLLNDVADGSAWIYTSDGKWYKTGDTSQLKREGKETFGDYLVRVSSILGSSSFIVADPEGGGEAIYYDGSAAWKITNDAGDSNDVNGLHLYKGVLSESEFAAEHLTAPASYSDGKPSGMPESEWAKIKGKHAHGSYGLSASALNLINEMGTEAIVTPQGTLTALPSRTGIVPADITKNLWELGEVTPMLLRFLGDRVSSGQIGQSIFGNMGTDESMNIANLVMNIDADSGFDLEKLVTAIRSKVALTKNSR